jgi:hypothetical protein
VAANPPSPDTEGYSNQPIPASIEAQADQFPPAVANFLEATSAYAEKTKSVSFGVY